MIGKQTPPVAALAAAFLAVTAMAVDASDKAKDTKQSAKPSSQSIQRGRYLVQVAGCNDCHTSGYMQTDGKVPEAQWLTGDSFGWRGPWGTTYAINLRLYMQSMSEADWIQRAKTLKARPPMPSYNLHVMNGDDLRAIYRYIRHAGPAGSPAPAYLPPDKEPPPPYATFPAPPK